MSNQISRRAVLGGLGAGVAFGTAGLIAKAPPAAAQAAWLLPGGSRVGATFDLLPFPAGTTYPQAVDIWNSITGTSMRCWKVYYQVGEFPTAIDAKIETMIDRNIQALISFKPAIQHSASERAKLARAAGMFRDAGLLAEACLWQEVGPEDMTADQYHAYVRYYGPAIRECYPLVFDAPGYRGPAEWAAYDPGHAWLDGYAVDYYCGDYVRRGVRLDRLATLAGDLPVGIWEIGNTAARGFMPTAGQVEAYLGYLRSFLTQRAASGRPVGSVAWYNGPANNRQSGQNEIAGTHPNPRAATDITQYRLLYNSLLYHNVRWCIGW